MLQWIQKSKYYLVISTLYGVIGPKEAKKVLPYLLVSLVAALFEMSVVVAIIPFVQYIEHPESVMFLQKIFPAGLLADRITGVMVLGFTLLLLLISGNGISALNVWMGNRFSFMQDYHLLRRLFIYYLKQPYSYFLNKNPAVISSRLLSDVSNTVNLLSQLSLVIMRGIVVVVLIALIFWKDPVLAIGAGLLLGGAYYFFYKVLSKISKRSGSIAVEARTRAHRVIMEVLGGIKEVKLARHEERYIYHLSDAASVYATKFTLSMTLSQITRYLMEPVVLGGMVGVLIYLNASGGQEKWSFSGIAFYGFAALRLLGAFQNVYSGLIQASHLWASTVRLEQEIKELVKNAESLPDRKIERIRFEKSFALKDISFRYSVDQPYLFENFSLEIPVNSTLGIKGKTGSGKSTLVDIMLGLLKPESGAIYIDGQELPYDRRESWQMQVGYVPQSIYLIDDTIRANIGFEDLGEREIDEERMREAARLAGIDEFIEQLPNGYETQIGDRGIRLSGGQRQRLGIARALYRRPAFLVLDEATSALDMETERKVMEGIRSLSGKLTIVMIAHRLSTLEGCDFILDLDKLRMQEPLMNME